MVYIPKHVTCFLKLAQQEEELRLEEEKFYEAKREAARIAKLQKAKEKKAKTSAPSGSKSWLGENEKDWDVWGSLHFILTFLNSMMTSLYLEPF